MATYLDALMALEYLLDKAGERQWRDWIRQDIALWKSAKDVRHHLSAYGGMGTINDVWISAQNGHKVSKSQEPWVDSLFDMLKGLCFQLTREPEEHHPRIDLSRGRYLPILNAFVANPDKNRVTSQMSAGDLQLHGWRCFQCGHAETNPYDMETYLANSLLPKCVERAETEQALKALVDAAFAVEFEGLAEARDQLSQAIPKSGIEVRQRDGWMRPCPKCGSDDTGVYRWERHQNSFRAAGDTLPVRRRAP